MGHPTLRKLVRKFLLKNSKETSRFCRTTITHREASPWGLDGSGGVRLGERGGREGGKRHPTPPLPSATFLYRSMSGSVTDTLTDTFLGPRTKDSGPERGATGLGPQIPPTNFPKNCVPSPTRIFYKTPITDRGQDIWPGAQ